MTDQVLINIGVGVITFLGGWLFRIVWQRLDEQNAKYDQLAEKITNLRVDISGDYVTRSELATSINAFNNTLQRIENKLDGKQDK